MAKGNSQKKSTEAAPEMDAMQALMSISQVTDTKAGKKDEHKTIQVRSEEVTKAINDYSQAQKDIADAEQRKAAAEEIIKPYGLKAFIADVKNGFKADRSFILANSLKGLMYIIMDGYKKAGLDKDRIAYLRGKYGKDIITSETEFTLNKELVTQKNAKNVAYGTLIAQFIMSHPDIPAEVKVKLLVAKTSNVIAKGTIDNLLKISADNKVSVEDIIADIEPTQQLKGQGTK